MVEKLINYPGPAIKIGGLSYVPVDDELNQDYLALFSPIVLDYEMSLRKMELINPSISDLKPTIDYKIGVDFMTNQPVYKYKENKKTYSIEEQRKDFEVLQDLSAQLRMIEEEGPIVFEKF